MRRKKRCSSPFEIMDEDFDDTSSQSSRNGNPPIQRNAANARERARMRVLSSAFGRLKTKLPNIPADTKLSKLDTLRLATMYIKQLKTVVEGGPASPTSTNSETIEGSLNNSPTNCYINLHSGAPSMNWPFGFHHHLTNSASGRSASSSSLLNSSSWCQNDIPEFKQIHYENESYHHHHETEQQQQQNPSYIHQHQTTSSQRNSHNSQGNHWYSETPSPELDTSSNSTCLCFENSHLSQQQQSHQQHHLSHLQPAITHSSTFDLQHNFQHHQQQQQHQQPQHLQHNYVNSSNFQSTSIR